MVLCFFGQFANQARPMTRTYIFELLCCQMQAPKLRTVQLSPLLNPIHGLLNKFQKIRQPISTCTFIDVAMISSNNVRSFSIPGVNKPFNLLYNVICDFSVISVLSRRTTMSMSICVYKVISHKENLFVPTVISKLSFHHPEPIRWKKSNWFDCFDTSERAL